MPPADVGIGLARLRVRRKKRQLSLQLNLVVIDSPMVTIIESERYNRALVSLFSSVHRLFAYQFLMTDVWAYIFYYVGLGRKLSS
jgi:hypothetical protein